jgi:hypothetical protein
VSDSTVDALPQLVDDLRELIGLPAALALVEVRGGIKLYVPESAPDDHELVRLIGRDATDLLISVYAREWLSIPRCAARMRRQRDDEILRQYTVGEASAYALARKFELTERHVRRILSGRRVRRRDPRQRQMF